MRLEFVLVDGFNRLRFNPQKLSFCKLDRQIPLASWSTSYNENFGAAIPEFQETNA